MSGLKRLIQEIHRRSLWQVLAIYLVGAAVGYQLIEALVSGLGLPAWFPALAIVLFIVGLPIVLATALVQEGARPAERPDEAMPTPEGGGAAAAEEGRCREAGGARGGKARRSGLDRDGIRGAGRDRPCLRVAGSSLRGEGLEPGESQARPQVRSAALRPALRGASQENGPGRVRAPR